jgi:SOS response regulatory protein OraA/RecX
MDPIIDKVASSLEQKGFIEDAFLVDIIANTVEAKSMGSESLRDIRNVVRKTSRPRTFVEIVKRIKRNIKGRPNARKILTNLKSKTPKEAILILVGSLPKKTINRAIFEKGKRLAMRLLTDSEEVKEEVQENVEDNIKVANTLELDVTAVLIALLSGIAERPIEVLSYIDVMKLLRPFYNILDKGPEK